MHKDKHIKIRGERRVQPDLKKLSRALIALALAQAEQEAQRQHEARTKTPKTTTPPPEARP